MALATALYNSDAPHANIDRVIAEAEKSLAILESVPDWRNNFEPIAGRAVFTLRKATHWPRRKVCRLPKALELLLRSKTIMAANYERLVATERARGHEAPNATRPSSPNWNDRFPMPN